MDEPIDNLLMISALQHYAFCPRQCALIHVEQIWQESGRTAEGRIMHERVHDEGSESRGNIRIERGVALRTLRLGLIGKADVVEFHRQADGSWLPFPVEYKRGKPKVDDCDKIQLCAQAICLEEMLGVAIQAGALFYGQTRRRLDVPFDEDLRSLTEEMATGVHALLNGGRTPLAVYSPKCKSCSLLEICRPRLRERRSAKKWIERALAED